MYELGVVYRNIGRVERDVAARLGIGEKTVEKQLAKGVRIIADLLFGDGETKRDTRAQREHEHGKQHRD